MVIISYCAYLCLYTNYDYSDLIIIARQEYPLHCVLVLTRSPVLKAAVRYNATKPTVHGGSPKATLDLTEDDHWAVNCMVRYFYWQDYTVPSPATDDVTPDLLSPWPHSLLVHTRVFALAEQYGIPSLKSVALAKFTDEVEHAWRSPVFADAIHEVYTSTVDQVPELREVVVKTFSLYKYDLRKREDIEKVFMMNPQLGYNCYIGS